MRRRLTDVGGHVSLRLDEREVKYRASHEEDHARHLAVSLQEQSERGAKSQPLTRNAKLSLVLTSPR